MKWKAIEPHRGDFETETPNNMINWAIKNNITVRGKFMTYPIFILFILFSLFRLLKAMPCYGLSLAIILNGHGIYLVKSLKKLYTSMLMTQWIISTV